MREIDYDEAWDVIADDVDSLVENVCEGYEKEVLEYLDLAEVEEQLKAYKKAYSILMDWFDYIPEENQLEVHSKLGELGL
tara:strand:- start:145 stop:384 length:240 start_codon:yes stop_codon:yes gene_type:complete